VRSSRCEETLGAGSRFGRWLMIALPSPLIQIERIGPDP
jgi:hypothetical protein